MHFTKSTFVLSLLALCHIAVAAEPPACLLSALGTTQPNPADLKAVCVTNATKTTDKITSDCGDDTQAALKYFSDTCSSAGYKVDVPTSKSHGTLTTDSASATGSSPSGFVTATATGSASTGSSDSSSTSTGSSSSSAASASPSAFEGAASPNRVGSAAAFAAAVFVGVAAVL
ncbi:hypothetical protein VTN00DRAFT_1421 [Thermoascus crustaceus]|uniref:uncharacterized protein n=1 Tax=Thermoascus crustaceus TaxID=5088 RepID=UPI003743B389